MYPLRIRNTLRVIGKAWEISQYLGISDLMLAPSFSPVKSGCSRTQAGRIYRLPQEAFSEASHTKDGSKRFATDLLANPLGPFEEILQKFA